MTLPRVTRLLLALATLLIVVWSFFDVGLRLTHSYFAPHRKITLTILHWGDTAENTVMDKLVARYEAEHPDIHIANLSVDNADYDPKLKTMFAADTAPDVFYLAYDHVTDLAAIHVLAPLDPYLEQERRAGQADWINDIYPVLLDAYKYDGHHIGAGPLYGIPKDFTTAVMYVNVDLFKQAGIPVPYTGWTWDDFQTDCQKITALSQSAHRPIYGGVIESWPAMLRNILWTFGGEFFNDDFSDTLLQTPQSQAALKMIRRLRFDDRTCYNTTAGNKEQGGQEFFSGNVGIYGPLGRWKVPRLRSIPAPQPGNDDPTHFIWDVVPVPRGIKASSSILTVSWSMSASTKHPKESYDLIKFLCGPDGQAMNARLGLALPALKSVANSPAFLDGLPAHSQVFLDAIPIAPLGQYPPQPEAFRIIERETTACLQAGAGTTESCAQHILSDWHAELASPLKTRDYPPMPWRTILLITASLLLLILLGFYFFARRENIGLLDRRAERAGWLFISPWLIGFITLTLGPMIASALFSLTRWTAMTPVSSARYVGLDNFRHMFLYDPSFIHSMKVTIYFVALSVPISQVLALAVALLMNARVRGITIFRTLFFIPSVVSGVVLAALWQWILNNQYGPLNKLLDIVLSPFHLHPPDWIGEDAVHWAVPAFVLMGLWGVGSGMVIYLAGLKGIPASLYEAARLDGASPFKRFLHITLPMLSPLLFYQLVMSIIGSFQIFTQAKFMTPLGGPGESTLFYVFNLYRQAFEFHEMGYASAMAWILFLLLLILTLLIFRASKNLAYYEGLKA
ncbi:MAG TPA: extracellular solute-binding protein [Tepidisphaeraceae bacterium]|jgi:multiple sugar transport system permease protein|nr:extracellular solute-binding protein [Tepidisphaeraceae bacterium]